MELLIEWQNSRPKSLCIWTMDKIVNILFKKQNRRKANLLALGVFVAFFEIAQLIFMAIVKRPILPVIGVSIIIAIITSLCIYSISWAHQYSFEQFEIAISLSPLSEYSETKLIEWIYAWGKIWVQVLASILFTVLVVIFLQIIDNAFGLLIYTSDLYTFAIPAAFWGCQGFYWGIATPLMTKTLRYGDELKIQTDPIYPNKTPILLAMSNMYNAFSTWFAVLITLSVLFLFLMKPQIRGHSFFYPFFLIVLGYSQTLWTYLYPQLNLAKIVSLGKRKTTFEIEMEISKIYSRLKNIDKEDFERLDNLMVLHKKVSEKSNAIIEVSLFKSFLGSLVIPTLVTIIGSVDWKRVIDFFLSLFL